MREVSVGCKKMADESCEAKFEYFQDELFKFLARRFGSMALAERIKQEMSKRLAEAEMLALVGNALSLGLEFMQADIQEVKRVTNSKALASTDTTQADRYFIKKCIPQGQVVGGMLWQLRAAFLTH